MTDGDGTFAISNQNGKWNLTFKISQSRYNLIILYYIKYNLGVGSISLDKDMGQFRIRDLKKLEEIILPIFNKYPLLTRKQYNYEKFKKARCILRNENLIKKEKDDLLKEILLENKIPDHYISPCHKQ